MFLTKKRLIRLALLALAAGVLLFAFLPFVVSNGLRLWIQWQARQQNLTCQIEKIEAPLLRPVVIRGIHLVSAADSPCRIDLAAARVTVELNLHAILLRMRERAIHTLSLEDLRAEIHRNHPGNAISESGWNSLQKMLPENIALERGELRLEDGETKVYLHEVSLRASQIEAGPFTAAEFRIDSPLFRRTFANLRGSAHWQGDHLTVAGVRLAPGLDMQSITADLSQLNRRSVGLEFDLDTFGGKMRANLAADWNAQNTNWNVTASATDVSLAQTSQSLGFTDRLDGVVHACKFTFRGNAADPSQATASLWTELTRLSWRNRAADGIMLGAALYNRQVQIQQLYVKQRDNQLTLNGELAFPNKAADWLNPDFRGTISASIQNLGDFAKLFGANPGDFAGQIAVEGTMNTGGRKLGGHLNATGKSLSIFKSPVDTFAAKINLKANDLEIEQLDVQRQTDLLHAEGKIDLGPDHNYSGTSHFTVANVAQYLKLLPYSWKNALTAGAVVCDWSGNGNARGHAGKVHLNGRALQSSVPTKLLPFNAEIDADYAPGSIFFRQAHLTNEHVSLNGFFTIASKYLQLQAIALDVNGKPKLRGNAFLPIALSKWLGGARLVDALDAGQKMDADLAVEPTDLAEFSEGVTGQRKLSGNLQTRMSIFGGLDGLQGWWEIHLKDFFTSEDPARTTTDTELRFASGIMNAKANIQFRGTDPVKLEAAVPVRLGTGHDQAGAEPFSGNIDFPKLSLARVPRLLLDDWLRDGVLTGHLAFSETMSHPKISGNIQLTNGIPGNMPLKASELAGKIEFGGATASVESVSFASKGVEVPVHGEIDFTDPSHIKIKLSGTRALFDLTPPEDDSCVEEIALAAPPAAPASGKTVTEIDLTGGLGQHDWALTLHYPPAGEPSAPPMDTSVRAFKFCSVGDTQKTLTLAAEPASKAEAGRPRKKSRRR